MAAEVAYSDASIRWLGRWRNVTGGKRAGFQSAYVRFSFTGTSLALKVASQAYTPETTNAIVVRVDGGAHQTVAVSNGSTVTVTLATGLTAGTHTATVQFYPRTQYGVYAENCYLDLKSIVLDDAATVSTYDPDLPQVLHIGDSISSATPYYGEAVPFLYTKYEAYPTACSSLRLATANGALPPMTTWYPYVSNGNAASDPANFIAVLIYLGTNDSLAGTTTAAFKTAMGNLIDQIRADYAESPIYCVQGLNPSNAYDFSIYGTVLTELTTEKYNVHFIETASINASITNTTDATLVHPDTAGNTLIAQHIESFLPEYNFRFDVAPNFTTSFRFDVTPKFEYPNIGWTERQGSNALWGERTAGASTWTLRR